MRTPHVLLLATALGAALPVRAVAAAGPALSINVKDHGAAGNGMTNDTAAIRAAIAAASSGGTVYMPPGTYNITAPFVIENTSNLTLTGAGPSTVLVYTGDFRGVQIGGRGTTTNITLQNVKITSGHSDGEAVAGRGGIHVDGDRSTTSGITIRDVIVENVASSGIVASGDRVIITNPTVRLVGEHGIYLSGCNECSITNPTVHDAHQDPAGYRGDVWGTIAAIKVAGGTGVTIAGGDLDGGTLDSGVGIIAEGGVSKVTVTGTRVTLRGTNHVGFRLDGTGIRVDHAFVDGGGGFAGARAVEFRAHCVGAEVQDLTVRGTWKGQVVRSFAGSSGCRLNGIRGP